MSEVQTTLQTEEPQVDLTDRRETLAAAFEQTETATERADRARDEAGRFAKEAKAQEAKTEPQEQPKPETVTQQPAKLTTWKKDYVPLHEKLAQGLPLTPEEAKRLADYNLQRESEYSTGISMHKDRASRLEGIEKAIAPFMPVLQQHNIAPDTWIANLGRAHHTLATGTPEQKLQMFQQLAQDYGIPLGAVQQSQQGSVDPALMGLMEQFQQLRGQVQEVKGWREQQEQQRIAQEIAAIQNDAENHPHFEKVRGTMAQLLESGLAPDLKTAYAKAVRMDDEVWQAEQARQSQAAQAAQAQSQVVAQAKAKAVSPRTSTPSGVISSKPPATDRRAVLAAELDAHGGRV
jgi:hypothetical protein